MGPGSWTHEPAAGTPGPTVDDAAALVVIRALERASSDGAHAAAVELARELVRLRELAQR